MYWVRFHFIDEDGLNFIAIPLSKYCKNRIPKNTILVTIEDDNAENHFIFGIKGRVSVGENDTRGTWKSISFYGNGWTSIMAYHDAEIYVVSMEEIIKSLQLISNYRKTAIWRVKKMMHKYAMRRKYTCYNQQLILP